jgi:hypothetical protein
LGNDEVVVDVAEAVGYNSISSSKELAVAEAGLLEE